MPKFPVIPFSPRVNITVHGQGYGVLASRMHRDFFDDHVLQGSY